MDQHLDYNEWFQQLRGCMEELGIDCYSPRTVKDLYEEGYSPTDAASELMEE